MLALSLAYFVLFINVNQFFVCLSLYDITDEVVNVSLVYLNWPDLNFICLFTLQIKWLKEYSTLVLVQMNSLPLLWRKQGWFCRGSCLETCTSLWVKPRCAIRDGLGKKNWPRLFWPTYLCISPLKTIYLALLSFSIIFFSKTSYFWIYS